MKKKMYLMCAIMTIAVIGIVPAFAVGEVTPAFNLSTTMTTAVTTIVNDLLSMIAAVLPITITLLAASIGIAYAITFIKRILGKA